MSGILLRDARQEDLDMIVALLADDPLGSMREKYESPLPQSYYDAFDAIDRDGNNELIVVTLEESIIGVMQITFIPYLTYQGRGRALIEGVRIAQAMRSKGIGRLMFEQAILRARDRGCHMVQLTTDKSRPDAIRFYESLGFQASHHGMKLHLDAVTASREETAVASRG